MPRKNILPTTTLHSPAVMLRLPAAQVAAHQLSAMPPRSVPPRSVPEAKAEAEAEVRADVDMMPAEAKKA
jgi:hypothetical protein